MSTPNAESKTSTTYQPRDPVFFMQAVCELTGALLPPSSIDSAEQDQAETAATICARLLDRGDVPPGTVAPSIARDLHLRRHYDDVAAAAGNPAAGAMAAPRQFTATAAAVEKARSELAALERARGGAFPKTAELEQTNKDLLTRLADVSEPVRAGALRASVVRLSQRPDVTGARAPEAVGVVIEEIVRAIRVAEKHGVHSRAGDNEPDVGVNDLAWPGNVAAAAAAAGFAALADEAGRQEEAGGATGDAQQAAP